jgi:hypothetical protein
MVLAATDCQLAGRYRLGRWLAAGGMGQVWLATDEVLGRPVAVKLLREEYAHDPTFARRLRVEARSAAAVTHPGVASIFDYGEVTTADGTAPTPFLVMELVDGEPLSWLLAREGRLGLDRSLEIGARHPPRRPDRSVRPGAAQSSQCSAEHLVRSPVATAAGRWLQDGLRFPTPPPVAPRPGPRRTPR